MPRRIAGRLVPSFVLTALLVAAPAAWADTGPQPPFELRFPQDTETTVFSSTFGAPRSGGRRHKGNDLMAPKLTEVYAAGDGVITVITTSRLAGRYVEIDHGNGWTTRYMHLNNDQPGTDDGKAPWSLTVAPNLSEGLAVEGGQLIGWVGDSGNAEWAGSHTHFELAYQGTEIDPYLHLKEAFLRDRERRAAELRGDPPSWRELAVAPT